MEFDPIVFRDFVRDIFAEWRGKGRDSVGDFASYLGKSQQVLSNWYNGKIKTRPDPESYDTLIRKYGVRAYDALGLPRPKIEEVLSSLSEEQAASVMHAIGEIRSAGLYKANATASPEELEKINDILSKHLGKYHDTSE